MPAQNPHRRGEVIPPKKHPVITRVNNILGPEIQVTKIDRLHNHRFVIPEANPTNLKIMRSHTDPRDPAGPTQTSQP